MTEIWFCGKTKMGKEKGNGQSRLEETLSKLEQLERSWQATLAQEEGSPVSAEEAALPPFRAIHALQQSRCEPKRQHLAEDL